MQFQDEPADPAGYLPPPPVVTIDLTTLALVEIKAEVIASIVALYRSQGREGLEKTLVAMREARIPTEPVTVELVVALSKALQEIQGT